jgi:hypothetical protein
MHRLPLAAPQAAAATPHQWGGGTPACAVQRRTQPPPHLLYILPERLRGRGPVTLASHPPAPLPNTLLPTTAAAQQLLPCCTAWQPPAPPPACRGCGHCLALPPPAAVAAPGGQRQVCARARPCCCLATPTPPAAAEVWRQAGAGTGGPWQRAALSHYTTPADSRKGEVGMAALHGPAPPCLPPLPAGPGSHLLPGAVARAG